MRLPARLSARLVPYRRLSGDGTLDRPPPQPELDQHRLLPAERAHRRGVSRGGRGGSDFSGRFPAAMIFL